MSVKLQPDGATPTCLGFLGQFDTHICIHTHMHSHIYNWKLGLSCVCHVCVPCNTLIKTKTAKLKFKISAQTAFRLSL